MVGKTAGIRNADTSSARWDCIAIYEQVLSRSLDTTALEGELSDPEVEINIAAELIEGCIKENAHVALDQDEYQKRYDALVARFDKAKARHTEVTDLIAERMAESIRSKPT